ncbi:MAG: enoyl-CoA hydratase [Caulobacterales bacterium]
MTSPADRQIAVTLDARPKGLVATVVIDNAHRLNSMNSALMSELVQALEGLGANPDLRVLILTGAGDRAFIGGADIKAMALIDGPDAARAFIGQVHACCAAVRAIPVPTIARIQGFTFGAGLEMAAACDLRIAAESAQFGMPEVRLGIPSVVEAALLPLLIGWGRARRLLLTGETIDAERALAWGLVEEAVPLADLDAAVEASVTEILACAPAAVRLQKALIGAWEDLPLKAAIAAGVGAFAAAYQTEEPARAMADFLEAQATRKARP